MKLPLLDYTDNLFKEVYLNEVLVIACQHILETNYILFEYLFNKGLNPENTFLLGKCYSTNKEILNRFRDKKVNISKLSLKFNPKKTFDKQYETYVKEFVEEILNRKNLNNYNKIVIIDDGGYLIKDINNRKLNFSKIIGIEQTSSGYNQLSQIKLNFPIVNVARSEAKLKFESPYIAKVIIEKLKNKLHKLILDPKKVLIVGRGPIGNEIYNLIKNDYEVDLLDKELTKNILSSYDLIIGATGNKIINSKDYKFLKKNIILVSVSSSDREFSAIEFRKQNITNCHKDIQIEEKYILNGGFPINFDGTKNSVKPKEIQFTRALIFSAVCLSLIHQYPKGFVVLDNHIQSKIIKAKGSRILLS